ncbi:MAG TPA: S41 family peptidase [Candidatus Hydrogenedentes bacterium]|nr:S41 family peptidase [Candidatus Hydrogenedentota bacterium]
MRKRNSKLEFTSLLTFLVVSVMLLSDGFVARISAESGEVDVYREIEPIGVVLDTIQDQYVRPVDIRQVVEGALYGMMGSLDEHSSFLSAEDLEIMQEDTQGEFEGIGVSIKLDEDERIMVFQPIPNSPAADAGIRPFDVIAKIDDVSTRGMSLSDAAERIRGPRGTSVRLTLLREKEGQEEPEVIEVDVRRDKVPLASLKESRLLDNKIAYIRISDFKQNTAQDLKKKIKEFLGQDMRAFVLDLRWNPGGLLTASKDVCELFLQRGALVTYTKGREKNGKHNADDLELYTGGNPVLPEGFPIIVLVNEQTASSSEIVTGALQYYKRALILGEKTFGKGSVQTIIPLPHPINTALRLTTALYYTPGDVTIDKNGILPDIEVPMDWEHERALGKQLYESFERDPDMADRQNHGAVTGNEAAEGLVEDLQLQRAVEILLESNVWADLIQKYHRDVQITQVAADEAQNQQDGKRASARRRPPADPAPADTPGTGTSLPAPGGQDVPVPNPEEQPVPDP